MRPLDIGDLSQASAAFRHRLLRIKAAHPSVPWYPYDSLANLTHLNHLLTGPYRNLAALAPGGRILDLGCADGDLAFFLESQGFQVTAVDNSFTNHNAMEGVRLLARTLRSSVDIHALDIDAAGQLPGDTYDLALLLGLLYHLKNPFLVLESLARKARHAVLSTHCLERPAPIPDHCPAAYLVEEDELNADNSNFWILTAAGLDRLLVRAGWEILDAIELRRPDRRIFALIRSCYQLANVELQHGFHQPEGHNWRWTERSFSLRARFPAARPRQLRLKIFLPAALLQRTGALQLRLCCNAMPLADAILDRPGDYIVRRPLPSASEFLLHGELDRALPPEPGDARERGLILAACQFTGITARRLS